jgi:hypothetical protein
MLQFCVGLLSAPPSLAALAEPARMLALPALGLATDDNGLVQVEE